MKKLFIIGAAIYLMTLVSGNALAKGQKPNPSKTPQIEVVFVLDTTGSMGGLIHAAKEKIWAIASSMAQTKPAPKIKIGLVAYRDRGDDYVTKRTDLTGDLDMIYDVLMGFEAGGGGDTPESVNQALHEAVSKINWSKNKDVYQVIFLVGDAPPHMDYQQDVKFSRSCAKAAKRNIVINAIQCGTISGTAQTWQQIASLALGEYFKVEQSGGAVIAETPYDAELAGLADELDDTKIHYGSSTAQKKAAKRKESAKKISAHASMAAKAQRAAFNTSDAGLDNFLGKQELISDMENGVDYDRIKEENLPEQMRAMSKSERKEFVKSKKEKRKKIKAKIRQATKKRSEYINKELKKDKSKAKNALGQKIYDAVRSQAAEDGMVFESAEAAY